MITVLTFLWLLGSDCKQPLPQETLNQLQLGARDEQLRPGESHQFALAILSTYKPAEEVPACITWKVEPEGHGATISTEGLLKIDSVTPAGSKFLVTADIEQGRAQRQIVVLVYTDKTQPLVGFWRQQARYGCDRQNKAEPINELEFRADGWFSVTWQPFETYRDYWGSYTTDAKGGIFLQVAQANFMPQDFRGSGKYRVNKDGTLEMSGLYLGDKHPAVPVEQRKEHKDRTDCRYVFARIP